MADISEPARLFMAAFFWAGAKASVTSHEPHATLTRHRAAYDECKAAGLVAATPWNDFGSITIKPTPAGIEVAETAHRERMRAAFPDLAQKGASHG